MFRSFLTKILRPQTLYWIAMGGLVWWYAYTKGWILADFPSISAQEALSALNRDGNITLIDVRTPAEYRRGRVMGAKLVPLSTLKRNPRELEAYKHTKLFVYCQSGNRSVAASRLLRKRGFFPVNIKGGIVALKQAGAVIAR